MTKSCAITKTCKTCGGKFNPNVCTIKYSKFPSWFRHSIKWSHKILHKSLDDECCNCIDINSIKKLADVNELYYEVVMLYISEYNPGRVISFNRLPAYTSSINLKTMLPKSDWDKIRKQCYKNAGYKCELCGEKNEILFCHEHWIFDYRVSKQILACTIALCELCHKIVHFRRESERLNSGERVSTTDLLICYCCINNCTAKECIIDMILADYEYWQRNCISWKIDFGTYETYITPPIRRQINAILSSRQPGKFIGYSNPRDTYYYFTFSMQYLNKMEIYFNALSK